MSEELVVITPKDEDIVSGSGGSRGKGGGGGGASQQRVAQEAPNTLRAKTIARIVDLIGEGPIKGFVNNSESSAFLDATPVLNSFGNYNFTGINYAVRYGMPDQTHVSGFASSENETAVNVEVLNGTPITRTVTSGQFDAVRVKVLIPALTEQNTTNGDLNGSSVSFQIRVTNTGDSTFTDLYDTISGKTVSAYLRGYRIELPKGASPSGPWSIQFIRTSANEVSAAIQNKTNFYSFTTIIDGKFTYPDSAYVALEADAQYFGQSIPTRSYLVDGLLVRIPSNYNPYTKVYTGIWNGTFATDWTDNPAWVLLDLITNKRYGMGIAIGNVDLGAFYLVAQYCDQTVPNGFGGNEPRFRFNYVFQQREDAYKIIQSICSTFRGMCYWSSGAVTIVADMPADPVKLVSPANVVDGKFTYTGTGLKARHSVALIRWNDPGDEYRSAVEVVEERESLERYGYNPTDVQLVGCTSRGQAHRYGKWLLDSEKNESETVTYRAALDHADLMPGDIISVADPNFAGVRYGGRILQTISSTQIVIDGAFYVVPAQTYQISITRPDGTLFTSVVTSFTVTQSVNWISDGGFESNTLQNATTSTPGAVTTQSSIVFSGTYALQIDRSAATTGINTRWVFWTEYHAVAPGETYELGLRVRSDTASAAGLFIRALWYDSNKVALSSPVYTDAVADFGLTTSFLLRRGTITVPAGAAFARIQLFHNSTSSARYMYVDEVRFAPAVTLDNNSVDGTTTVVLSSAMSFTPEEGAMYALSGDVVPRTFRVVVNREVEDGQYEITALAHDPTKFARVELGLNLDPLQYTRIDRNSVAAPTNLAVTKSDYFINNQVRTRLSVSWTAADDPTILFYELRYLAPGQIFTEPETTAQVSFEIKDAETGEYQFEVRSVTADRRRSQWVTASFNNNGKTTPPTTLTGLAAEGGFRMITLTWTAPPDRDIAVIEIWSSLTSTLASAVKIAEVASTTYIHGGLSTGVTRYYWIRSRDSSGNVGAFNSNIGTSATTFGVDLGDVTADPMPIPSGISITQLRAVDALGRPILRLLVAWNAIVETDFGYYSISYRDGTDGAALTSVVTASNSYVIEPVYVGRTYYAKIEAYNTAQESSGFSAEFSFTPSVDTAPPGVPTSLSATAAFATVAISWTPPAGEPDVIAFEVWRATTNSSGASSFVRRVTGTSFSDTNLAPATQYFYFVKSVDVWGNVSAFSASTNATTVRLVSNDLSDSVVTAAKIANATIDAAKFAAGIAPVEIVSSLPGSGLFEGRTVYLTTDDKLYRYTGSVWTAAVSGADITAGTLAASAFPTSLRPVEVVATLPVSGNFEGRLVFLTTDDKLYRHNGTAFTSAVPTSDLSGVIVETQISNGAITTNKILAGSVTANQIASGTIIAGNIAAGAITASKLFIGDLTNAIKNPDFATGNLENWTTVGSAWTALRRTDGAVPANAPGQYVATRAANGGGTASIASELISVAPGETYYAEAMVASTAGATGPINLALVYANANPTGSTSIDFASLASPGTTWTKISGIVTVPATTGGYTPAYASLSVNLTPSGSPVGSWFVTNVKLRKAASAELIVDGAITANKIAASAVTATTIAAGAITAGKIAADAVTAGTIAAGAVNTAQLAANAITADKIAAGAITASKLVIGNFAGQFVPNGDFEEGSLNGWDISPFSASHVTANNNTTGSRSGAWRASLDRTTATPGSNERYITSLAFIPVEEGERFVLTAYILGLAAGGNNATLRILWYTGSQVALSSPVSTDVAANAAITTTWTEIGGAVQVPSGARYAKVRVIHGINSTTQIMYIDGVSMIRQVNTVDLVAGSVTSSTIASGAVGSAQIANDAVGSAQIANGAVGTTEIGAGAVATGNIATNAITTTLIQDGAIVTGKIAANAVTATQIAANTITAAQIAAGTITADRIATGTITASQIAADTITATQIAANAISASEIAANAITTDKIQAGAITASRLTLMGYSIFPDPYFDDSSFFWVGDAAGWQYLNRQASNAADVAGLRRVVTLNATNHTAVGRKSVTTTNFLPGIAAGSVVTLRARGYNTSTLQSVSVEIQFFNLANASTGTSNITWAAGTTTPALRELQVTVPAGTNSYKITVYNQGQAATAWNGIAGIGDITVVPAASANMIVDGAISANKIAADAVVADKIAANAITTIKIAAGSVTTDRIAANAITSDKVTSGLLITSSAQIGTAVIQSAQIGDLTVTNLKVANGAISNSSASSGTNTASTGISVRAGARVVCVASAAGFVPDAFGGGSSGAGTLSISNNFTGGMGSVTQIAVVVGTTQFCNGTDGCGPATAITGTCSGAIVGHATIGSTGFVTFTASGVGVVTIMAMELSK
jgi:predicted phage tail protein